MDKQELQAAIKKHGEWLNGCEGGERLSLIRANLQEANLWGANLRGATLWEANLWEADLRGCVGNGREIKSMQINEWPIVYTHDILCIGCQQHKITDWWGFTDGQIADMATGALEWWKTWKPILQQIITLSPATPTGK